MNGQNNNQGGAGAEAGNVPIILPNNQIEMVLQGMAVLSETLSDLHESNTRLETRLASMPTNEDLQNAIDEVKMDLGSLQTNLEEKIVNLEEKIVNIKSCNCPNNDQ